MTLLKSSISPLLSTAYLFTLIQLQARENLARELQLLSQRHCQCTISYLNTPDLMFDMEPLRCIRCILALPVAVDYIST